jgi:hypothetical protein
VESISTYFGLLYQFEPAIVHRLIASDYDRVSCVTDKPCEGFALALRAVRCEKLSAIGAAYLRVSLAPPKYAPDPIPNAAPSVPRWRRFPGFSNVLRALAGCPGGRLDPF